MAAKSKSLQQAAERYEANRAEAKKIALAILAKLEAPAPEDLHWGHAGDVGEIVGYLKNAAHWAGVEGYVEQ